MAQDRPTLTFDTVTLLERLARLMRSAEHGSDLNPAQWATLRYLSRCNRFSNAPTALADYLAATKGTVSQTINTLHKKGYIEKGQRPGEGRSVTLTLTELGEATLCQDPLWELAEEEMALPSALQDAMARSLKHFIRSELGRQSLRTFGTCGTCPYFAPRKDPSRPNRCTAFDTALTEDDLGRICYAHETNTLPT